MIIKKDVAKKIQLAIGILFVLGTIVGLVLTLNSFFDRFNSNTREELNNFVWDKMDATNTTDIKEIVQSKGEIILITTTYENMFFFNEILIVSEVILLLLSIGFLFKALKE